MPRYTTVFESSEEIYGIVPKTNDWVHYSALLQVKDGGKFPVVLDMEFVPPHPFAFDMPKKLLIRATSITAAYSQVSKLFRKFGIRFR
jgi:hypothetical protein